jgi:hypothetical protein
MYSYSIDPPGTKLRNRTGTLNVWYACSMHVWHTEMFSYASEINCISRPKKHSNPSPVPCRLNWLNYSTPFIVTFKSEIVCTIVAVCSFSLCTLWTTAFLSSHSSAVEDYIILGYRITSLGNRIPTFRGEILSSSSRVLVLKCLCLCS